MTFPEADSAPAVDPAGDAGAWPDRPLLLVGAGLPAELDARLAEVASALAALLDRPQQRLAGEPAAALASLQAAGPVLAWLPTDPGCWLAGQGTWAEALGAWRQPTLGVIAAPQLAGGQAAALVALLRQERVPLLGLLQWQGPWQPEARRGDGLPWLGHGSAATAEDEAAALDALELVLARRWAEVLGVL